MLVAPGVTLSAVSIGFVLIAGIGNLLLALPPLKPLRARMTSAISRARQHISAIPATTAGQALVIAQIGVFVFIIWHFLPLISAMVTFINPVAKGSLAVLGPDNYAMHNRLREVLSLDLVLFLGGWYWVLTRSSGKPSTFVLSSAGGATILLLFLFSMPYRLLYHNESERVLYGSETCYLVGQKANDALLFCPKRAPRTLTVNVDDPMLSRTGITEEVFSEFDRSP